MAFVPQNFKPLQPPAIKAVWLNGIDVTCNSVLAGAQTVPQALAALGIVIPVPISQGGTGATDAVTALANLGGINSATVVTIVNSTVTASYISALTGPATPAEIASGFATVPGPQYVVGNGLRYGLVPNSSAAAGANSAILAKMFSPTTSALTGYFFFPDNGIGAPDSYYFNATCPVKSFIHLDLGGCNVNIIGASTANDVNVGWFYALSDVIIENGVITTAVDTTLGVNSAACIMIGARGPGFYYTYFDSLASHSLGRVTVRNLTLVNQNTGSNSGSLIQGIGGITNSTFDNINFNCNGVVGPGALYYEWGWANMLPTVGNIGSVQTSHAHNVTISNFRVLNCPGVAVGLTGAYNCSINGLYTNNCKQTFVYSVGEAMFFRPWVGVDQFGAKRNIALTNVVSEGPTGGAVGLQLVGSNSYIGTFWGTNGVVMTPAQQTDLMTFTVDNIATNSMVLSGSTVGRNIKLDGNFEGTQQLNPLTINDDAMFVQLSNLTVLNGSGSGIRADVAGTGVWSPVRQKYIEINGGLIAGNAVAGIEVNNVQTCQLSNIRFGFSALNDGQGNEPSQQIAVLLNTGCSNVVCRRCLVTLAPGGTIAYNSIGTTSTGNNIIEPKGVSTTSGAWAIDGLATDIQGNIASSSAPINLSNKYFHKRVLNSSTNVEFLAQGSTPSSAWISVDALVTLNPT